MRTSIISAFIVVCSLTASAQMLDVKDGLVYGRDGKLYSGEIITNGTDGVKQSEAEIVDGKLNGAASYYYNSGSLMETGVFFNGLKNGPWVHYSEAGKKVSYGNYSSGKKDGKWIMWDDKGVKRYEMNYLQGEKTGTWYIWDENGNLIKTTQYGNS